MKLAIAVAVGLTLGLAAGAPARRPPPGRNVKVLVQLSPEELYGSMLFVSAALGVRCDHCHAQAGFDRDEKPAKETARKMMRMVADLRRVTPPGAEISCYTCHRGQPKPQAVPPLASDSDDRRAAAGAPLPSLDEVLAHHRRATGDEARLARLRTIVLRGHVTFEIGGVPSAPAAFELVRKAPDKILRAQGTGADAMTVAATGTAGWRNVGGRTFPLGGIDLGEARREGLFAATVDARAPYERMTVTGTTTLAGTPAVVVSAVPRARSIGPLAIDAEELTFDASTGLLLRGRVVARSALGATPMANEYGDFRTVDGVTLPFLVRRVGPGFVETMKVDEIELDAPVADERFAAPK